jgi:hypothetical protein
MVDDKSAGGFFAHRAWAAARACSGLLAFTAPRPFLPIIRCAAEMILAGSICSRLGRFYTRRTIQLLASGLCLDQQRDKAVTGFADYWRGVGIIKGNFCEFNTLIIVGDKGSGRLDSNSRASLPSIGKVLVLSKQTNLLAPITQFRPFNGFEHAIIKIARNGYNGVRDQLDIEPLLPGANVSSETIIQRQRTFSPKQRYCCAKASFFDRGSTAPCRFGLWNWRR